MQPRCCVHARRSGRCAWAWYRGHFLVSVPMFDVEDENDSPPACVTAERGLGACRSRPCHLTTAPEEGPWASDSLVAAERTTGLFAGACLFPTAAHSATRAVWLRSPAVGETPVHWLRALPSRQPAALRQERTGKDDSGRGSELRAQKRVAWARDRHGVLGVSAGCGGAGRPGPGVRGARGWYGRRREPGRRSRSVAAPRSAT
jgi:hypothetical protein